MNDIFYIVIMAIGFIIGYIIGKRNKTETFANDAERIKSENIAKLKEYLNTQTDEQINNEEVRKLLNVSDTTACRYLNDLEKENLIRQIGTDGPKVFYKKN